MLPINKDTLVYGSDNGGTTVHNDSEEMYKLIKQACKQLNLKKHMLGSQKLYGPG